MKPVDIPGGHSPQLYQDVLPHHFQLKTHSWKSDVLQDSYLTVAFQRYGQHFPLKPPRRSPLPEVPQCFPPNPPQAGQLQLPPLTFWPQWQPCVCYLSVSHPLSPTLLPCPAITLGPTTSPEPGLVVRPGTTSLKVTFVFPTSFQPCPLHQASTNDFRSLSST